MLFQCDYKFNYFLEWKGVMVMLWGRVTMCEVCKYAFWNLKVYKRKDAPDRPITYYCFISYTWSSTRFDIETTSAPTLFNDLQSASNILDPIIFADDTNLFFSNCNIPVLFATINSELSKISQWFLANKLSLNVTKTKYSFFHKTIEKGDILLRLPRPQINNYNIKIILSIKFLGVLFDENPSWKDHIKYIEKKISKNIGISYKARDYLSKESLLSSYYAYIHTYINYANLAWVSTIRTNLKKIHIQQKHAIRLIFCEDKFSHTKELFVQNKFFNVYY